MNREQFIKSYVKDIRSGKAAVFAGAGLSASAGYVNWATLLKDIAQQLGLDSYKEGNDLPALAQYYRNEVKSRNELTELILNEFNDIHLPGERHHKLVHLPIHTFWTTNYDHLLEKALKDVGKIADVKKDDSSFTHSLKKVDATVYKMHGDVIDPAKTVLLKEEYENYPFSHPTMQSALKLDLLCKNFLFVGFSFTDPNLSQILGNLLALRSIQGYEHRTHYCILRKASQNEGETDDDFHYRQRKEELFANDLQRLGIQTVWIEQYEELDTIINELHKEYYKRTVFISGAAYRYEPWGKDKAEEFVFKLSQRLVSEGFRLVSGYGLGIGNSVVCGAMDQIYMKEKKQLTDEIITRPFPQGIKDFKRSWRQHREDMISYSGISLFIFGNKIKDGEVILSDGMQEEYEISERQGNILIPIASTGYKAKELYDKLMKDHDTYNSHPKLWDAVSNEAAYKDINELVDNVMALIKEVIK
jgi:hypothetical protein